MYTQLLLKGVRISIFSVLLLFVCNNSNATQVKDYKNIGVEASEKINPTVIKSEKQGLDDNALVNSNTSGWGNELFVVLTLILTLVVLIQAIYLRKTKLKLIYYREENSKKGLEHQKKELVSNLRNSMQNYELVKNVSDNLLQLKRKLNDEDGEEVQKIILQILDQSEPKHEDDLELHFHEAHGEFYKKLKKLAPDLSSLELKICALLKLNMTFDEISILIHQNAKSIENKCLQIRQALGLANKDIQLNNYLAEL